AEGVLYRDRIDEQPAHVPVGADHPHHDVAYRLTACLRSDVGDLVIGHRRAVLAYAPVLARRLPAFELFGCPPEDALRRGVREDHGTGRIAYTATARHRVIDGGEIVLRTWCRHRGTPSSRHARQRDLSRCAFRARSATGIGSRPERLAGGLSGAASLCRSRCHRRVGTQSVSGALTAATRSHARMSGR